MSNSKYQETLDNITETNDVDERIKYRLILQELVDKVTPKKPIKDRVQDVYYLTKYTCPTCDGKFTGTISDYCYHCGQALNWEEE